MIPLTKIQIIDETVNFYSEDPTRRANQANNRCVYNTSNGKHCAIGRCLLPKYHEKGITLKGNTGGVGELFQENGCNSLDEMLQEQYHGHDQEFWTIIQNIHDEDANWLKNDISKIGIFRVNHLKDIYQNQ